MAVVRYVVDDVDRSLPFYRIIGFRLADRWGPPFAVMKGPGGQQALIEDPSGNPLEIFMPRQPE